MAPPFQHVEKPPPTANRIVAQHGKHTLLPAETPPAYDVYSYMRDTNATDGHGHGSIPTKEAQLQPGVEPATPQEMEVNVDLSIQANLSNTSDVTPDSGEGRDLSSAFPKTMPENATKTAQASTLNAEDSLKIHPPFPSHSNSDEQESATPVPAPPSEGLKPAPQSQELRQLQRDCESSEWLDDAQANTQRDRSKKKTYKQATIEANSQSTVYVDANWQQGRHYVRESRKQKRKAKRNSLAQTFTQTVVSAISPRVFQQGRNDSTQTHQYETLDGDSTSSSRAALIDRGAQGGIIGPDVTIKEVPDKQDF